MELKFSFLPEVKVKTYDVKLTDKFNLGVFTRNWLSDRFQRKAQGLGNESKAFPYF